MKKCAYTLLIAITIISCTKKIDPETVKKEIVATEKSFEKMAAEKGIPEAFHFFADSNAIIKRQNDELLKGRQAILDHFKKETKPNTTVTWAPDFVAVSDGGDMAYTYGKYLWKVKDDKDSVTTYKGIYHTVWKRQADGSWKYTWD